jgi:hypothetical protein
MWFIFCLCWTLGGAVDEGGRKKIDNAIREADAHEGTSCMSSSNTVYEWLVDGENNEWISWTSKIPEKWQVAPNTPF